MTGCFGALEAAVLIIDEVNFPHKFPNVQVAQCGECLLPERESASLKPGVDILLFFPF